MRQSRLARLALVFGLVLVGVSSAYAQGGSATSSITGTVLDSSGGAIPGATVVVTGAAGGSFTAFTNAQGVFALPSMNPGTYTVTVTLSGFKTAVVSDVRLLPGQPFDVKVQLEIGQIEETITVATSAEIINTQTATVSSTLNADQLNRMPSVTRNALNAIIFLPGVNTPTTNRNSTVNGLPESFLYITLDGVTNQDNFNKTTDGFFASVYPRQDAVEAVTVTTAATGANQGGSGAVSINFVTRSGTNQYSGSAYEYYRNPAMNTNYWFNENAGLPKNEIRLHQFGARFGGPIVANRAFFFAHYEHLRFPNSFTRTRTTFADEVLDGWFPYAVSGNTRRVNVLQLAAANGQISAIDPVVLRTLTSIKNSLTTTGAVSATTDPLRNSYEWQSPGTLTEHQPTVRLDVNLNERHRLSGSGQVIWAMRDPDYLNSADARFPGAPNYRVFRSTRPLYSATLRSTLGADMVNEVRLGLTARWT
ncbi:MAG TPA: TonB-dependent receptor, partial [Vicinamibacterales bacterium]|nr:TonB-dependent receptor [Vicinamibacterales bacterium]